LHTFKQRKTIPVGNGPHRSVILKSPVRRGRHSYDLAHFFLLTRLYNTNGKKVLFHVKQNFIFGWNTKIQNILIFLKYFLL